MADFVAPEDVEKEGAPPLPNRAERFYGSLEANKAQRPKRVSEQVRLAERRLRMAQMAAGGMVLRQIAEEMGVSITLVSQEIDDLILDYQGRTMKSVGQKIARELAVLDMVAMEATLAWFDSKSGRLTNTKKRKKLVRAAFQRGAGGRKDVRRAANVGVKPTISRLDAETQMESDVRAMFADDLTTEAYGAQPEPTLLDEFADDDGPVFEDEEQERHETSVGAPEFLRIIIECHEKRCRLEGLYKLDNSDEGAYSALTAEQRAGRILALAQDLRAAKALHEQAALMGGEPVGPIIDVTPARARETTGGNGNGSGAA